METIIYYITAFVTNAKTGIDGFHNMNLFEFMTWNATYNYYEDAITVMVWIATIALVGLIVIWILEHTILAKEMKNED